MKVYSFLTNVYKILILSYLSHFKFDLTITRRYTNIELVPERELLFHNFEFNSFESVYDLKEKKLKYMEFLINNIKSGVYYDEKKLKINKSLNEFFRMRVCKKNTGDSFLEPIKKLFKKKITDDNIKEYYQAIKTFFLKEGQHKNDKQKAKYSNSTEEFKANGLSYTYDYIQNQFEKIFEKFWANIKSENILDNRSILKFYKIYDKYNKDRILGIDYKIAEYKLLIFLLKKIDYTKENDLTLKVAIYICQKLEFSIKYIKFINNIFSQAKLIMSKTNNHNNNSKDFLTIEELKTKNVNEIYQMKIIIESLLDTYIVKSIKSKLFPIKGKKKDNMDIDFLCESSAVDFLDLYFLFTMVHKTLNSFVKRFFITESLHLRKDFLIDIKFNRIQFTYGLITIFQKITEKLAILIHSNSICKFSVSITNNPKTNFKHLKNYIELYKYKIYFSIIDHAIVGEFKDLCLDTSIYCLDYFYVMILEYDKFEKLDHETKKIYFKNEIYKSMNSIFLQYEIYYTKSARALDKEANFLEEIKYIVKILSIMISFRFKIQRIIRLNFLSFRDKFPHWFQQEDEKKQFFYRKHNKNMLYFILLVYKDFYKLKNKLVDSYNLINILAISNIQSVENQNLEFPIIDQLNFVLNLFSNLEFEMMYCDFSDSKNLYIYDILYSELGKLLINSLSANINKSSINLNAKPIVKKTSKSIENECETILKFIEIMQEDIVSINELYFLKNIYNYSNIFFNDLIPVKRHESCDIRESQLLWKYFQTLKDCLIISNKQENKVITNNISIEPNYIEYILHEQELNLQFVLIIDSRDSFHFPNQEVLFVVDKVDLYENLFGIGIEERINHIKKLIIQHEFYIDTKNIFIFNSDNKLSIRFYIFQKDNEFFFHDFLEIIKNPESAIKIFNKSESMGIKELEELEDRFPEYISRFA